MKPFISLSEKWSKEQDEIWETVVEHWGCLIGGKIDQFLTYIHPKFVGFGHESPLPVDRTWLERWVGFWGKNTTILYDMRPIHIVIHENIAVVQYVIFTIEKNLEGARRSVRRYTMTWQKTGKKWQVIASHNNLMNETV
jgi:hypothetical protein